MWYREALRLLVGVRRRLVVLLLLLLGSHGYSKARKIGTLVGSTIVGRDFSS